MEKTKVFQNGGSVAVRLPKKYALPLGDVMIDERGGLLVILPLDGNGWPEDLETRFSALADLEIPTRNERSKPISF